MPWGRELMMDLVELLDQIRDDYLDQFLTTIEEKQSQKGVRIISEPSLRNEDGTLAVEGAWEFPVRTDIAVMQNDELSDVFNVVKDSLVDFEPVEFDWGKTLHVELGPFAWQNVTITMPNDPVYDWTALQEWFWKWFQDDDDVDDDDPEAAILLGAIHSLSDPVVQDDVVEFTLDLGSAPIAAFEELLDAFAAAGVTLCAIGNVPGT
jgi:hypothetical protein